MKWGAGCYGKWGCVEGSGRWPGWVIVSCRVEHRSGPSGSCACDRQVIVGCWSLLVRTVSVGRAVQMAKWGPVWGMAPLLDGRRFSQGGWSGWWLTGVGRNSQFDRSPLLWKFSSDHSQETETRCRWQNRTHSRKPPGFWCFPSRQGISERTGTPAVLFGRDPGCQW